MRGNFFKKSGTKKERFIVILCHIPNEKLVATCVVWFVLTHIIIHYTLLLHTTHLGVTHYTLHISICYTIHTSHYTLHIRSYILHITHINVLHITHYTLGVTHYTLHISSSHYAPKCVTHYTLYATNYTLGVTNYTLRT